MNILQHNRRPTTSGDIAVDSSCHKLHELGHRIQKAPPESLPVLLNSFVQAAQKHIQIEREYFSKHYTRPYSGRHIQLERSINRIHEVREKPKKALEVLDEFYAEAFLNGPFAHK